MSRTLLAFGLVLALLIGTCATAAAAPAKPTTPTPPSNQTQYAQPDDQQPNQITMGPTRAESRSSWSLKAAPCPPKKGMSVVRNRYGKCIYFYQRSDGAISFDGKYWMTPGYGQ